MGRRVTKGKCYLCGGTFGKVAMTRHLSACRRVNPQPGPGRGQERTCRLFHLVVQGRGQPEYWLHLEVPADGTLAHLDTFLRRIWLECCGHLSAFTIGEQTYFSDPSEPGDKGMGVRFGKVLDVGKEFRHEYDFGSTTELTLKVVAEREGLVKGKSVQLLARNDPPLIMCAQCGETAATQVCSQCVWEGKGELCDACAAEHECDEEMLLPVVNSPRVGVCAYTG